MSSKCYTQLLTVSLVLAALCQTSMAGSLLTSGNSTQDSVGFETLLQGDGGPQRRRLLGLTAAQFQNDPLLQDLFLFAVRNLTETVIQAVSFLDIDDVSISILDVEDVSTAEGIFIKITSIILWSTDQLDAEMSNDIIDNLVSDAFLNELGLALNSTDTALQVASVTVPVIFDPCTFPNLRYCSEFACCISEANSFTCSCLERYYGNGKVCQVAPSNMPTPSTSPTPSSSSSGTSSETASASETATPSSTASVSSTLYLTASYTPSSSSNPTSTCTSTLTPTASPVSNNFDSIKCLSCNMTNGMSGMQVYTIKISRDGRWIFFGTSHGFEKRMYRYDQVSRQTEEITLSEPLALLPGYSPDYYLYSISPDASRLCFQTGVTWRVEDVARNKANVYSINLDTDELELVGLNSLGVGGNGLSGLPWLSYDGSIVAFSSYATNLVPGDTNDLMDTFVYDFNTRVTTRASFIKSGEQWQGGRDRYGASTVGISDDGRYVLYVSFDMGFDNSLPGEEAKSADVFMYDRVANSTILVSKTPAGTFSNGAAATGVISGDGKWIFFSSTASDLVANDTNGVADVFAYNRETDTTTRVSVMPDGTQWDNNFVSVSWVNSDGRYVLFISSDTSLFEGDTNQRGDIFMIDNASGDITLVSARPDGIVGNSGATMAACSDDGRYVALISFSTNFSDDDQDGINGGVDAFVFDLRPWEPSPF